MKVQWKKIIGDKIVKGGKTWMKEPPTIDTLDVKDYVM